MPAPITTTQNRSVSTPPEHMTSHGNTSPDSNTPKQFKTLLDQMISVKNTVASVPRRFFGMLLGFNRVYSSILSALIIKSQATQPTQPTQPTIAAQVVQVTESPQAPKPPVPQKSERVKMAGSPLHPNQKSVNTARPYAINSNQSPAELQKSAITLDIKAIFQSLAEVKPQIDKSLADRTANTVGTVFSNIDVNPATQIHLQSTDANGLNKKIWMPANMINLDGSKKILRSSYPKPANLHNHLEMIMQEQINDVVVLASETDIKEKYIKQNFSFYFNKDDDCKDFIIKCEKEKTITFGENTIQYYKMSIQNNKTHKEHTTRVLHMEKWADFGVVTPEQVLFLAREVKDSERTLTHCIAGAGRTGVFWVTQKLLDMHEKNHLGKMKQEDRIGLVAGIVKDIREKACGKLVQTLEQFELVCQVAEFLAKEK